MVGPVFSHEAMKPDIKRLNPVTNIKNMFKFKTLFELLKSIFKITGALILIYTSSMTAFRKSSRRAAIARHGSAQVVSHLSDQSGHSRRNFLFSIGLSTWSIQKKNFAKEMKMEKFEVKQEYKDTEGDPHDQEQTAQTVPKKSPTKKGLLR